MKKVILILVSFFSIFLYFQNSNALDIFDDTADVIYCQDDECSLSEWTKVVKKDINDIETNRKFSVYIQDVIKYLLTFISIVAVLYIIYAWFKLLTSAWDDEWAKKSKSTIVSVLIWIVIIWLAYSIVSWILKVIMASN